MRNLFLISVVTLFAAGCTSRTPYGPCIGLNGNEDPKLVYHYDGWNIGMGILFFSVIIPPIVVGLDELKCPIGYKNEASK